MLSKVGTLFVIFASNFIHIFSCIFPRNKKTWIFIGWRNNGERQIFADNSKYMFLAASQEPGIQAIWMAEDKALAKILRTNGYASYSKNSPLGIYYSLRAGTTFIDANFKRFNWQWSGGSQIIQLWHGKGFKITGHENRRRATRHRLLFPELYTRFANTIATSQYTAEMMSKTMCVPLEKVLVTGLPREDILFEKIAGSKIDTHPELETLLKNHTGTKILYAPTFRRWEDNPLDHLDLNQLQAFLARTDTHFVLSLHPKYQSKQIKSDEYKNIHFISPGYDLQPYISSFDTIVTDYSNIFLEFLLLDKHTIFYTYDIERYKKESGLYDDYDNLTPGPHVKNTCELIKAFGTKDEYADIRKSTRDTLYTHHAGGACSRIISALQKD